LAPLIVVQGLGPALAREGVVDVGDVERFHADGGDAHRGKHLRQHLPTLDGPGGQHAGEKVVLGRGDAGFRVRLLTRRLWRKPARTVVRLRFAP
jgi:hypothetical protein